MSLARWSKAAKKANVILGVAHVFRFEDSTARLRDRIAEGQIGKPVFARSEFSFPGNREHPRTWLRDPAIAGGGAIADVGCTASTPCATSCKMKSCVSALAASPRDRTA